MGWQANIELVTSAKLAKNCFPGQTLLLVLLKLQVDLNWH